MFKKRRLKFTLTRKSNPMPLDIYIQRRDIMVIVSCPCTENCEIRLMLRDGRDQFVDGSPESRKMLGLKER